jgi:transcriptional regulator with XRE-family HTH domain
MNTLELKQARKRRGWTQGEAALRLGVSQSYLSLLENGKRELGPKLARKAVNVLELSPTVLPLCEHLALKVTAQNLAQQLASLGYPGFAYLRASKKRNPSEVLITALAQDDLESRLTEGLPWLLLRYSNMCGQWLVDQARLRNLSNRLGFVVALAKGVSEKQGDTQSNCYQALLRLEQQLSESRLDKEDTLCQSSLSPMERTWLKETRPPEAEYWHVLTDWRPEHLQYAT